MSPSNGFTGRLQAKVSGPYQTKGAAIMRLSDALVAALRGKLMGLRDINGMPLEPAKVRALALNTAQHYLRLKGF